MTAIIRKGWIAVKEQPNSPADRSRLALAFVLVMGAGLLFLSLLTLWVGALIVWLLVTLIIPIMVFLSLVTISLVLGRKLAPALPGVPWVGIVLLASIIWPLAFCGPIKLSEARLQYYASREIPYYPGAEIIKTFYSPLGNENRPGAFAMVELRAVALREEVGRFYRTTLGQHGWQEIRSAESPEGTIPRSTTLSFEKPGRFLQVYAWEGLSRQWQGTSQIRIGYYLR